MVQQGMLITALATLFPLLSNLARCYGAILNDARIISRDPALQSNFEILYAYPGFWALFWYRLSHALLEQRIPVVSAVLPRVVMSIVRYATAIDIHPGADISSEGVLIDHGAGLVVGATAIVGGGVTLYHGVTLGNSGKKVPAGTKRHPTVGNRVVVGAGAKILGDIVIGDDVLVGANSVVTKPVPPNHTAVGVPARVLCHGSATGKDVTGAAICELHKRLKKVEEEKRRDSGRPALPTSAVAPVEKNAPGARPDEAQQVPGERRESSSIGRPLLVESVPFTLRSPRDSQPVALSGEAGLLLSEKPNSEKVPARFVLEKAAGHPPLRSPSSGRRSGQGQVEWGEGGIAGGATGEILYSLRVLEE